jgi:pimeloyl-ACP methyl ester carboxylesterase
MRVSLGDVSLWFDVSGPSVVPQGDTTVERPVLVALHGGPGLDHIMLKYSIAPLAEDFQILYVDLRGHGRSDHSSAEFWNLKTWADDLRRLCDALGLRKPIILGSSFGGFVAFTYAALFPDHPGAVILTNTTGGHRDEQRVVEAFGRVGGDEAAAAIKRTFTEESQEAYADYLRICYPLYSAKPGWAEEAEVWQAQTIRSQDVAVHYHRHEAGAFDPWSMIGAVSCPMLILAGEDDPICPLPVVEELASQLPAGTTSLVRLPGAGHTIFRDRPDLAFPAIRSFVSQLTATQPAS